MKLSNLNLNTSTGRGVPWPPSDSAPTTTAPPTCPPPRAFSESGGASSGRRRRSTSWRRRPTSLRASTTVSTPAPRARYHYSKGRWLINMTLHWWWEFQKSSVLLRHCHVIQYSNNGDWKNINTGQSAQWFRGYGKKVIQ